MPVYEYQCEQCQTHLDLKRVLGDKSDVYCPVCGGRAKRLFSSVPVIYNGSGFYCTDNRGNGSGHSE